MRISQLSFIILIGLGASCGDPDLTALNQEMEEAHLVLVTEEHYVIEHFFDHQEFHNGLVMECTDQSQHPYPTLTEELASMRNEMISMQEQRAEFYNYNLSVKDSLLKALISRKPVPEKIHQRLNDQLAIAIDTAQMYDQRFKLHEGIYDSICTHFNITFVSHKLYADSLLSRIMSWEDSLEAQGSAVAKAMQQLKATGWDSRSDQYRETYQPVSEMQAYQKKLEQAITGANNAHNRYDSSRPTDGYYTGPFLVERHDVIATEAIFPGLDSLMREFRNYESAFNSALN